MLHIISGKYKNRRLAAPKSSTTRPTSALVRGAVFNMLQGNIEDAHVLDLCAGCGAMGLEALSRGAAHATFIEKNHQACQCIISNLSLLKAEKEGQVLCIDAMTSINRLANNSKQFDLIYIDPPYDATVFWKGENLYLGTALLHAIDYHQLLKENGWLFVEGGTKQLTSPLPLTHLHLLEQRHYGRSTLSIYRNKF